MSKRMPFRTVGRIRKTGAGRFPVRKLISVFLSAVISMSLFAGCTGKPAKDPAYTFTADTDARDGRRWSVQYDANNIVTCAITEREDENKTDFVFTGVKSGKVLATLRHVNPDEPTQAADNVYVLKLLVDHKGRVSVSDPPYGALDVDCGNAISGAEWRISFSDDDVVHVSENHVPIKLNGDGMQGYNTVYTFTGRRPGAVHVTIETYLPWCDITNPEKDFWLYVDREYQVSELKNMTDFQSFCLSEQNMAAIHRVYEAQKTDTGVRLVSCDETRNWSYEENAYVPTRQNEVVLDGDDAMYRAVAGLLAECGIEKWDGFNKSNPRILDGKMFTFDATLADGTTLHASGSNSYPNGYATLKETLRLYMQNT